MQLIVARVNTAAKEQIKRHVEKRYNELKNALRENATFQSQ